MLLVPTDFSPCADRAVERAIAAAKPEGRTVAPCPVLIVRDERHDPQMEVVEPAGQPATERGTTATTGAPPMKPCLLCAKPSELSSGVLCPTCMARVEAEAREAKRRAEKAGRIDTGRR